MFVLPLLGCAFTVHKTCNKQKHTHQKPLKCISWPTVNYLTCNKVCKYENCIQIIIVPESVCRLTGRVCTPTTRETMGKSLTKINDFLNEKSICVHQRREIVNHNYRPLCPWLITWFICPRSEKDVIFSHMEAKVFIDLSFVASFLVFVKIRQTRAQSFAPIAGCAQTAHTRIFPS